MIDTDSLIADSAAKILAAMCGPDVPHAAAAGTFPQLLWDALQENGLTRAWVSEANGGFGAAPAEVFGALWNAASVAAPVPLAETLIANWLLDAAGLECAEGMAGFALVDADAGATIAFGNHVPYIVLFDRGEVALFANPEAGRAELPSLSPDGATRFVFSGQRALASGQANIDRETVAALILTVRAVQSAAALEAALQLAIDHVSTREQFGRPLSKFQAIQQPLALAAAECAAATMAATLAAAAFARNPETAWHDAACAKVQIGHAIEPVTATLHQVHGAIGYTQEYALHHYTRRLWAWRDELGNENIWAERLGVAMAGRTPDQLWQGVTTGAW